MNDPHLDTAEAARRAGVSGDTIRRWARLGYLHPQRVGPGRRYRIDAEELAAVINGSASATTVVPAQSVPAKPAKARAARQRSMGTAS